MLVKALNTWLCQMGEKYRYPSSLEGKLRANFSDTNTMLAVAYEILLTDGHIDINVLSPRLKNKKNKKAEDETPRQSESNRGKPSPRHQQ